MISIVHMGSFIGICPENTNMIDNFKSTQKLKDDKLVFDYVRKIAIEAPSGTKLKINDVDILIPSTGIFELGLDYINISNLTFETSEEVNIIYFF